MVNKIQYTDFINALNPLWSQGQHRIVLVYDINDFWELAGLRLPSTEDTVRKSIENRTFYYKHFVKR
jgi:hypothetical protein